MQGQRGGRLTTARRGPAAQAPAFCLLCVGAGNHSACAPPPQHPLGLPTAPSCRRISHSREGLPRAGCWRRKGLWEERSTLPMRSGAGAQVGWGGPRPPGECQAPHLAC